MSQRESTAAARGEYAEALRDLEWIVAWSAGELGLHAQAYSPVMPEGFDPGAAHDAHISELRRAAVARYRRIQPLFDALTETQRLHLRLAFTPRQWPMGLRAAFRMRGSNACLAGLARITPAAIHARELFEAAAYAKWLKKCEKLSPEERRYARHTSTATVIDFLRLKVGDDGTGSRDLVRTVLAETTALLRDAFRPYDAMRLERERERRSA